MCSKVNTQTAVPDQKEKGCCCGSATATAKVSALEHSANSTSAQREKPDKDTSGDKSGGCCGEH
jgi:hypothetical protein